MVLADYLTRGWMRFAAQESIRAWALNAREHVLPALDDEAQSHWWRCGRTWFVGVDALPNDGDGRLSGGPPLEGAVTDFIHGTLRRPVAAGHRGQISVCLPGYPRKGSDETEAAHVYRVKRDSAHVDGLHGEGDGKRRHLRELHDFILGVPLDDGDAGAAPFVIWEGSHVVMREMFQHAFSGLSPASWGTVDVTEAYQAARHRVFETCPRVEVAARVGECYLAHRHALHGVAPWRESGCERRAIAYFRPCHYSPEEWLGGD